LITERESYVPQEWPSNGKSAAMCHLNPGIKHNHKAFGHRRGSELYQPDPALL
jgi:hypothetical protein